MEYEHILQTVVMPHVDFDTITHFFGLNKPLNAAALDQACVEEARGFYMKTQEAQKHLTKIKELEDQVEHYDDQRLDLKAYCAFVWNEPVTFPAMDKHWGSIVYNRYETIWSELLLYCQDERLGIHDYDNYYPDLEPPEPDTMSDDDE